MCGCPTVKPSGRNPRGLMAIDAVVVKNELNLFWGQVMKKV